jgi:gamma-glutamyltranspeptidase/glutathione hydrolase
MSKRAFGTEQTGRNPYFPRLLGTHGAVATHHYLSAQAARDALLAGGNAIDAAVAATLVEGVVNANMYTIGGECPMLIYLAQERRVVSVNGNMTAPGAATPAEFRRRGLTDMPDENILCAGVPSGVAALLTALMRWGRLTFADVAATARDYARQGFPVHKGLVLQPKYGIAACAEKFRRWQGTASVYLPGGQVPKIGSLLRNPALADFFDTLLAAEQRARGKRERRLQAVYDEFYRGSIAAEIERFSTERDGLLRLEDFARYDPRIEEPARLDYRNATVFKCGPENQGPVTLQGLSILENFDLRALGHNSAGYVHTVAETLKLTYADREQYYGDPRYVYVPLAGLLSKGYGRTRAGLIDPARAEPALRPGNPLTGEALLPEAQRLAGRTWGDGTVHVDAIDSEGNLASFTPSGGWIRSQEVIPALGFALSNRMQTFYLGPAHHPNVVAPGKRPRTTISPTLVFREGKPWIAYGSMGGDQQDQWMLQFVLNMVDFGMTLQEAIEAPKFSSEHFPGFFAPHDFIPNRLRIESSVGQPVLEDLARRGHDLEVSPPWTEGYLLAAAIDPETGLLEAGCDPRGEKSEVFPAFALAW